MVEFFRKGSMTAGIVGVLSLVLMVGIIAITSFSGLSKQTSTTSQAAKRQFETVNFGLKVQIIPAKTGQRYFVNVSWDFISKITSEGKLTISIFDSASDQTIIGGEQKILSLGSTSMQFQNVQLANNKQYYIQLSYIPLSGTISVQRAAFLTSGAMQ